MVLFQLSLIFRRNRVIAARCVRPRRDHLRSPRTPQRTTSEALAPTRETPPKSPHPRETPPKPSHPRETPPKPSRSRLARLAALLAPCGRCGACVAVLRRERSPSGRLRLPALTAAPPPFARGACGAPLFASLRSAHLRESARVWWFRASAGAPHLPARAPRGLTPLATLAGSPEGRPRASWPRNRPDGQPFGCVLCCQSSWRALACGSRLPRATSCRSLTPPAAARRHRARAEARNGAKRSEHCRRLGR
jgi:hypothetical protein